MTAKKSNTTVAAMEEHSLLDQILSSKPEAPYADARDQVPNQPLVGLCVEPRHPSLLGRALFRWTEEGTETERWLPMLHGMSVRKNDRVLIQFPLNSPEAIVVGVIDGFKKRPEPERLEGPSLSILDDESIKVIDNEGNPILELFRDETGPVVKLLSENTSVDIAGKLRINAKEIELNALQGRVKLSATDDVVIDGEMIKLNS